MPAIASRITTYGKAFDVNVRTEEGCPFHKGCTCCYPTMTLAHPEPPKCALESTEDLKECPLEKHPVILRRTPDWLDKAIDDATWKHANGG